MEISRFSRNLALPRDNNIMQRFETEWGGKTLSIEVEKFANQANGSCVVQYGETVVMATAVMSDNVREGLSFFPLMVDFEENLWAAGRIKGSRFVKRKGRPTDEAVLTSRLIDRAIRPLFNQSMRNDIQVIVTSLVYDEENDPDVIGLIAASCALHISDIPWNGPIANIRVGRVGSEWVINPTTEARKNSDIDLSFAGTPEKVIMVEAGANEADEDSVLNAFWFGMKHLAKPMALIEEVRTAVGKEKRQLDEPDTNGKEIENKARPFIIEQTNELFFGQPKATKKERKYAKEEVKARTEAFLLEQGVDPEEIKYGTDIIHEVIESEVTRAILERDQRVDGRSITQIRDLTAEVALLPRVHGSGHFLRGQTQVLSVATLGAPGDEQLLDGMREVGKKRFFHHYSFPPYSVGETKPMRGPSRRDIGHGALAEKAITPMLPEKEDFPYTIQVNSETLSSNGSSSMAATCGATLALMDAGVPLKAPVAGIAMGIASDDNGNWKVITDIQDLEDGKGGMDFKIAGSKTGITAIQMDTKTTGLNKEIIETTFHQAREARMYILDVMSKAIAEPRTELSQYAPRIISLQINPERIGDVIGPGGKIINEIIATTGVQAIDIEDDGHVFITSANAEGAEKAEKIVKDLTREIIAGETFKGKVVRLMQFGAFVEIMPKRDGMVHVSELAPWRVEKVDDIVKVGDEVMVKVIEIDDLGRINLSMKQAEGNTYPERPKQSTSSHNHTKPTQKSNNRPRK